MIMVERSEDHPEKWFSVKRRWQADLRRQIFLSWRYGYSVCLLIHLFWEIRLLHDILKMY
ncbi:hypothetical protein T4B_14936 [Trichinella pseudospiralis]|uniref:Uncharacterized protein n=1 Tax=Trichinella pseudospiralis TaxID=6337 RepID=A0A0V1JDQ3_TRIPS|nr:hypothetical protein T4B_14936 [Trichinella pseudospiralis]